MALACGPPSISFSLSFQTLGNMVTGIFTPPSKGLATTSQNEWKEYFLPVMGSSQGGGRNRRGSRRRAKKQNHVYVPRQERPELFSTGRAKPLRAFLSGVMVPGCR